MWMNFYDLWKKLIWFEKLFIKFKHVVCLITIIFLWGSNGKKLFFGKSKFRTKNLVKNPGFWRPEDAQFWLVRCQSFQSLQDLQTDFTILVAAPRKLQLYHSKRYLQSYSWVWQYLFDFCSWRSLRGSFLILVDWL